MKPLDLMLQLIELNGGAVTSMRFDTWLKNLKELGLIEPTMVEHQGAQLMTWTVTDTGRDKLKEG